MTPSTLVRKTELIFANVKIIWAEICCQIYCNLIWNAAVIRGSGQYAICTHAFKRTSIVEIPHFTMRAKKKNKQKERKNKAKEWIAERGCDKKAGKSSDKRRRTAGRSSSNRSNRSRTTAFLKISRRDCRDGSRHRVRSGTSCSEIANEIPRIVPITSPPPPPLLARYYFRPVALTHFCDEKIGACQFQGYASRSMGAKWNRTTAGR